jgi:hypothetical protein
LRWTGHGLGIDRLRTDRDATGSRLLRLRQGDREDAVLHRGDRALAVDAARELVALREADGAALGAHQARALGRLGLALCAQRDDVVLERDVDVVVVQSWQVGAEHQRVALVTEGEAERSAACGDEEVIHLALERAHHRQGTLVIQPT